MSSFTSAAIKFIKKAEKDDKPFYVNVWPDDVHSPFFPPKERRGDQSKRDLYHGVLDTADEQLGVLFDYVRNSEKLRDNTLILVCSDNGPEQGAGSAGPFKGFKTHLYEGGIRSSLIAWGPGLIDPKAAGTVNRDSFFAAIDLAPTLAGIAGIPRADQRLDGQPLKDVLLGKSTESRKRPVFFRRPPDRDSYYGESDLPDLAVRDGDWKLLCEYDGSMTQLYNLKTDRGETTNVAKENPEIVERLTQSLLAWHQRMPKDKGDEFSSKKKKNQKK